MKFSPALQTDLLHDAFLVVVAQRAAQLVVVHGWTVLLDPPEPGHLQTEHQAGGMSSPREKNLIQLQTEHQA